MVNAFVQHPDQWKLLRDDPSLARGAIEEVMRWDGPVIHFFRTTASETEFAGATLPTGAKVLLHFNAAHRDPRKWADPHRFDITRNAGGHFGFGFGIHQCLGQTVARQQMMAVLQALLRHASSLELAGEPLRLPNNESHALESLPIEVGLN